MNIVSNKLTTSTAHVLQWRIFLLIDFLCLFVGWPRLVWSGLLLLISDIFAQKPVKQLAQQCLAQQCLAFWFVSSMQEMHCVNQ